MPRWTVGPEAAIEENPQRTRPVSHHRLVWVCSRCRRHRPSLVCSSISQGHLSTCLTPTARRRKRKQPQLLLPWHPWLAVLRKLQRWPRRKQRIDRHQCVYKCHLSAMVSGMTNKCRSSFQADQGWLQFQSVEVSSSGCLRPLHRCQCHHRRPEVRAARRRLLARARPEKDGEVDGTRRRLLPLAAQRQPRHRGQPFLQAPGLRLHRPRLSPTVSRVLVTVTLLPLQRRFILLFYELSRLRRRVRGSCVRLVSFHVVLQICRRALRS
mmetsp:Transcript_53650/g.99193  ORF Transcript_53650/g.99193 Transcript_53650/m.99193 type:complete len:267 (-) Transcript_53650:271-1071(-)